MFDFDIGKMLVVAIVALAVIPPKDLPRVMRTVGQVMGRMRRMAAEFQGQFMDAMREAEFESVRKELAELNAERRRPAIRRAEPDDGDRQLRPGGDDPRRGDQGRRAAGAISRRRRRSTRRSEPRKSRSARPPPRRSRSAAPRATSSAETPARPKHRSAAE